MASKKEHRRKQKSRADAAFDAGGESSRYHAGPELNYLNLLEIYGAKRVSERESSRNEAADGKVGGNELQAREALGEAAEYDAQRRDFAAPREREAEFSPAVDAQTLARIEESERQRHIAAAVQARHDAEKVVHIRQEAEAADLARRAEAERMRAEEEDFRRRQASAEAMARRAAEEAEQAEALRRQAREEEERRQREADEARKAQEAEEARWRAAEEERTRREAEEAERAKQKRLLAEEEDFRQRQAAAEAMARRAAEEAEQAEKIRLAEIARAKAEEEEERLRRQAEAEAARIKAEAEAARIKAEDEVRRKREAEAAEQARREAEEAEKIRLAEIARAKAEEEEERLRRRAEAEAARKKAEEAERRKREAEAAEQARREAEEAEKIRLAEIARAKAEEEFAQAKAESARRRNTEAMERARRQTELARLDAEMERQHRHTEEACKSAQANHREYDESDAIEHARYLARKKAELLGESGATARKREGEAAEAVRQQLRQLREVGRKDLPAETPDKTQDAKGAGSTGVEVDASNPAGNSGETGQSKPETSNGKPAEIPAFPTPQTKTGIKNMETVATDRTRKMADDVERARKMAEDVEHARIMAEKVERARIDAEEAEKRHQALMEEERLYKERAAANRAAQMAAETEQVRKMAASVDQARRMNDGLPPAPLEFDNPHWQRQPEIFDSLSGAPRGQSAATPSYAARTAEETLPVTMAAGSGGIPGRPFVHTGGNFAHNHDIETNSKTEEARTVLLPPEKRMYVVMVTPEVAPCAKVGGLGDVILGLGRELMKRGHSVEVICPMYSCMRYDQIEDLHEEYNELWCPHYGEWRPEKVFQGKVGGILPVNFITLGKYTERENIYGYDDDLQRFAYFSRAAMEFMYKSNRRPEIIHCHDWATGLVPAMLWDIYEKLGWTNSRCVYTIHNNECQGLCGWPDKLMSLAGLDAKLYMRPDRMQDDAHKNCLNMMKGGIVYSNFVTTVSPTYATELKTVLGGHGLQTTFVKNSAKLGGVLNGIDYDTWNPATDPKIPARYSAGEDFYEKYKNKTALREWLGMWDAWRPIISVVTRLTAQKGLDLIKQAIFTSIKSEAQFVLLGSAPDPKINNEFLRLQAELKDNHDVNLYIGYHEDLSRLIYAGSDMFLVPSLYEPCGLTQMISLRYGTVPIVRETGGLVDTVFDLDNSGKGLSEANGFTFRDASTVSLNYGLSRAIRLWYENPEAFNRLARNGMRYDYSWRNPAVHYENIYNYIRA